MNVNNKGKKDTRFIVIREFRGTRKPEEVFEGLIDRKASESYEKWRLGNRQLTSEKGNSMNTLKTA